MMTDFGRLFGEMSLNLVAASIGVLALFLTSSCTSLIVTPTGNPITPTGTPSVTAIVTESRTATAVATPSPTPTGTSVTGPTATPTASLTATPSPSSSPAALRVVGYFFGSDRHNHVSDIAAAQLTDVLYAFADVTSAGECATLDATLDQVNFQQLRQLQ